MNRTTPILGVLARGALVAAALALVGCQTPAEEDTEDAKAESRPTPVYTAPVLEGPVVDTVDALGVLAAETSIPVTGQSAGVVVAVHVDVGDRIEEGKLLVELTNPDTDTALKRAKSTLRNLKSERKELAKLQKKGYAPRRSLSDVDFEIKQARLTLTAAKDNVDRLEIVAPRAATVIARTVEVGMAITPATPLFEVANVDTLEVAVDVPERHLVRLAPGDRAHVIPVAVPEAGTTAAIDRIDPTVDSRTGTAKVYVQMPSEPVAGQRTKLRPGMHVEVSLVLDERPSVPLVARQAIVYQEELATVFAVRDGKAVQVEVKTGTRAGEWVELLVGPNVGEDVVVVGQGGLPDGAVVESKGRMEFKLPADLRQTAAKDEAAPTPQPPPAAPADDSAVP